MLGAVLISMVVMLALVVSVVWALMWASRRWLSAWASIGIGGLAVVYFVQSLVRGIIHCSQPPRFIPPEPGSGGEGRMEFNCDSAGGMLDRLYLYALGPATVAMLLWLCWRFWPRAGNELGGE